MLMRFDPFREVDRFAEEVDQMFRRSGSSIPMDAVRHGNQVFVSFDLPGVDPDAIDLTVERDTLTVTASRKFERAEGDEVLAGERPQGTFTRRVLLGQSLDTGRLEPGRRPRRSGRELDDLTAVRPPPAPPPGRTSEVRPRRVSALFLL